MNLIEIVVSNSYTSLVYFCNKSVIIIVSTVIYNCKTTAISIFFSCYLTSGSTTLGHSRAVDQPRHTPNGPIMRVTIVMNLGFEPRTLVVIAQGALTTDLYVVLNMA